MEQRRLRQGRLFGDRASGLSCTTAKITQRFLSAVHFAEFFIGNYGPTLKTAEALDDGGREAFRRDLIAVGERFNRPENGCLVCDWEYLVAVATKA